MHRLLTSFRCQALSILLLLAAGASTADDALPAPMAEVLSGPWAGARTGNGTPEPLLLEFASPTGTSLDATLTRPFEAYRNRQLTFRIAVSAEQTTLRARLAGGEWQLMLDADARVLRGVIRREGEDPAQVFLRRVIAPPPVSFTRQPIEFVAGVDRLVGEVLLPAGVVEPPVAVMVTGRGNGDRGDMMAWAELLASHGVGALVFDSRGTGQSTLRAASFTDVERLEDVHAALNALAARDDIGCAGLLASSAGGWVAPVVAAAREDVHFLVTLVSPVESLADQQGHVTVAFMEQAEEPFSDEEYAAAFTYQQQTVLLAQADAPWSAFAAINAPARAARWAEHALIPAAIDDADLDYFRRRRGFQVPPWNAIRVPALAIFGAIDPVVPPAVNVPLLRAMTADHPDITIVTAPGADHDLRLARGWRGTGEGWPSRWHEDGVVHPQVYDALTTWFAAHFAAGPGHCRRQGRASHPGR